MSTYDNLKRQSRTLESLLDVKLNAYARLASSISLGQDLEAGGSVERRQDIENEIEGLLEKVCFEFCIYIYVCGLLGLMPFAAQRNTRRNGLLAK